MRPSTSSGESKSEGEQKTEFRMWRVEGRGQRTGAGGKGRRVEGRGGKIEIGSGKAAFDKLRRVKVGRRTEAR